MRYEVHEEKRKRNKEKKRAKKTERKQRKKGVCGVATERWPHTFLYRARAGAWAARELHVRGARVTMSSAHVARSRVNSG